MSSNKKKICLEEAMIFSAGRGSRMRYRTKFIAKPLIKLRNKELLKVNLDRLRSSKVKHCVINTSYKHYTIKQFVKIYHFRNKSPKISLIHEEQRLETGGGFKNAIVVKGKEILNPEGLRNQKEFVNHKILDCIGDLYTTGYRIVGSIKCSQGGHYLTNKLLRKIFENNKNFSILEIKEKNLPHTLINKSFLRSIA